MTTTADLAAVATAIALVADANTKAALNAVLVVLNDLNAIGTTGLSFSNNKQAVYPAGYPTSLAGVPASGGKGATDIPNPVVPSTVIAAGDALNAPLTITTSSTLISGVHGVAYTQALAATGGSGANVWSAVSLPAGLALSSSGVITGTIAAAGNYTLIATVTNGVGSSTSKLFLISIV